MFCWKASKINAVSGKLAITPFLAQEGPSDTLSVEEKKKKKKKTVAAEGGQRRYEWVILWAHVDIQIRPSLVNISQFLTSVLIRIASPAGCP